ncbi:MAG: SMC-Scp complex subunit ScpB [Thermoanaerobaculia bacterium]
MNELRAALEAILFISSDPVKIDDLAESFPEEGKEAIASQLEEIRRRLDEHLGGFALEQTAGGWRLASRPEHDSVLKKFFGKKGENRLSIAALETLAIIAYRQPITAPEVSDIRGVNATGVIRTLLERRMIRVSGRKNVVGSPFLYRTSKEFLVHFGLDDIRDLPRLEEFGDLIGETINDDLVAAISAAPEADPSQEIESAADERSAAGPEGESDDGVGATDEEARVNEDERGADVASPGEQTREREDVSNDDTASNETQLESPGSEPRSD